MFDWDPIASVILPAVNSAVGDLRSQNLLTLRSYCCHGRNSFHGFRLFTATKPGVITQSVEGTPPQSAVHRQLLPLSKSTPPPFSSKCWSCRSASLCCFIVTEPFSLCDNRQPLSLCLPLLLLVITMANVDLVSFCCLINSRPSFLQFNKLCYTLKNVFYALLVHLYGGDNR